MNISFSTIFHALGSPYEMPYGYIWAGLASLVGLVVYAGAKQHSRFDDIPAIGGDGFLSSWFGAARAVIHGNEMIEEGHRKFKKGVFRVPEIQRWRILVSSRQNIEEMLKAPEDVLSMLKANHEIAAAAYTLGGSSNVTGHHVPITRGPLTRNLEKVYPELYDEITHGFEDNIPVTNEWIKVKAYETALKIVSRATNRVFLGLPKCRDQDYLDLNIRFAVGVILGAQLINMAPNFLRPLVGNLLAQFPSANRRISKHLQPIIEERRQKINQYGSDYPDKPNDALSWLMDSAKGEEGSVRSLAKDVLNLNFSALHTSSMSFTHVLYHLATRPEYLKPLREEIETVIAEEGWNKAAIERMHKLDSVFKESMRVAGLGTAPLPRKAVKPFTFSDGTHIPLGAFVSPVYFAQNDDGEAYPDGDSFDGFRFSGLGNEAPVQFVEASTDLPTFGYGRHACPGRFFAATEVKTMMAHLLLTYDIKMENEGVRPENEFLLLTYLPNRKAEVLFRRRQAWD